MHDGALVTCLQESKLSVVSHYVVSKTVRMDFSWFLLTRSLRYQREIAVA